MATTTYTDSTFSVNAIGGRTDASGEAVGDYTAEEARFLAQLMTAGYFTPSNAFKVSAQSTPNMTVKVGSGSAKTDYYAVEGQVGGQGTYLVRLDTAGQNLTVPAADASQVRTDQVYLVVRDDAYDAAGLGLPRLAYRKGDLGGDAPGPDASWEAYSLLASITVNALATAITNSAIDDERPAATLTVPVEVEDRIPKAIVNAQGDLIIGIANDTVTRFARSTTDGFVLATDSTVTAGLKWVPRSRVVVRDVDTSGATADIEPDTGDHFRVTATSDLTVAAFSGATDGQVITIEHYASGGARTLVLHPNDFVFGETVTGLKPTTANKRDFIRAMYLESLGKWLVVGYAKGF